MKETDGRLLTTRRRILSAAGAVAVAGCLGGTDDDSAPPGGTASAGLRRSEAWTDTDVASERFDSPAAPLCGDGTTVASTVDVPGGLSVPAHEFVRDQDGGRYGVRGRIERTGEPGSARLRVAFFDGPDRVTTEAVIVGTASDEVRLFTVVANAGDPSAIDRYELVAPLEADSGPGPTTDDGVELVDRGWGILGTADGATVYGFAVELRNETDREQSIHLWIRTYLDDETVVQYDHDSARIEAGDSHSFYFPYYRCDPGNVADVELSFGRLDA